MDTKLPVLIFIHMGAYFYGSGNIYGPDFFIDKDIIVVTFNYRLGPFGFLTLDTPEYSGNMGLKDQALALKWVYENVNAFDGDRNQITLYGNSAGGASANFHMISSTSKNFFQRAILSSGCGLNPWAFRKDNQIRLLKTFGRILSIFSFIIILIHLQIN